MKKSFEEVLERMRPGETVFYEPVPDLEKRTLDIANHVHSLEERIAAIEDFLSHISSHWFGDEDDGDNGRGGPEPIREGPKDPAFR